MRSRTVLADEHLSGSGEAADARADVHCEPADVVIGEQLAFAGVQTSANLQAQVMDPVADRDRAADRAAGTIEHRARSVAERLHSPSSAARSVEPTMSVNSTVASTRSLTTGRPTSVSPIIASDAAAAAGLIAKRCKRAIRRRSRSS